MSETIEVRLPEAPPAQYLRWMAFWREVEQKMGESPALESMASLQSAPFIHEETASYLSRSVVKAIVDQANAALKENRPLVGPVLAIEPHRMVDGVKVVAARTRWMTDDRCRAMGIEPLAPTLVALRSEVLVAVAQQIAPHMQR